jgi:hypothetical protein
LWPNFWYYPVIFLEELRKTTKHLSHNSRTRELPNTKQDVRFQVLMAASMKVTFFCDVAPWRVLMMEAASTSETPVNMYQTT